MLSLKFKNVYINDYFSVVGPLEKESRLKKIDIGMDDYYFGEKTFEKAEVKMQRVAIKEILDRNYLCNKDVNLLVGGDLTNQIAITNVVAKEYSIPFLGIYSACATFAESLIVGSTYLERSNIKKVITVVSSHNLTAERQFRYPVEYGAPKPHTATFTSTGAVASYLSNVPSNIKVETATIGKVIDLGIDDANHMGAVMAPAAANTLMEHLRDTNREWNYYDLILTGDLGCIGGKIFCDYLKTNYGIDIKNHMDAGCELYLNSQDTYAGASGPSCIPLVLYNKILTQKKYKKILIIATGALHSPTLVNQRNTIPAIAHAVSLEVI